MSNSEESYSCGSLSESDEIQRETEEQIIERYTNSFKNMGYTVQAIEVHENISEVHVKINNRWYAYDIINGIQVEDYNDEENEGICCIF